MEGQEFLEWLGREMKPCFEHRLVTAYRRPWWKLWRKRYSVACLRCGLVFVREPRFLHHPAGTDRIGPIMAPGRRQ